MNRGRKGKWFEENEPDEVRLLKRKKEKSPDLKSIFLKGDVSRRQNGRCCTPRSLIPQVPIRVGLVFINLSQRGDQSNIQDISAASVRTGCMTTPHSGVALPMPNRLCNSRSRAFTFVRRDFHRYRLHC